MKARRFGFAVLSIVAMTIAVPAVAPAAGDKIERKTLDAGGKKHAYYLFVPDGLKGPAPLLVLFHGSGRNGSSIVEPWRELAAREGIALVGPDAVDSSAWRVPLDGPAFVRDLVEELEAKYPIDPKRVYLFGHSGGAVFALNLAMLESAYFAAAAVHAGAFRGTSELAMVEYSRRAIPISILVGDRDPYFSLEATKATNDALKAKGCPVEVTILKNHDHDYYRVAKSVNELAWEALRKTALAGEAKYESYQTAAN
jgi:poly(3-hydroxybutyrate) depolymerase